MLWTDYHQKLVDHALISMDTYLGQFPDIKVQHTPMYSPFKLVPWLLLFVVIEPHRWGLEHKTRSRPKLCVRSVYIIDEGGICFMEDRGSTG